MAATKDKRILDPVLPDQGGRMMPVDPLGVNVSREEAVRKKAYDIYTTYIRSAEEIMAMHCRIG
jgi:hypothetical protein